MKSSLSKVKSGLLKKLEKSYSEIVTRQDLSEVPYGIGTQSLCVDLAIGRPGLPVGRLVEVVGLEGCDKTSLAAHIQAETQRKGGMAVLFETESAMELDRLRNLGVDVDGPSFARLNPSSLEDMFALMEQTVEFVRRDFDGPLTFVLDSLPALCTDEEGNRGYDKRSMGRHANVIKEGLKKLLPVISNYRVLLVFINQLYDNLDPYTGEKYISWGGKGPRYRASVRLFLRYRRGEREKIGNEYVAKITHVEVIKNKMSTPFREAQYKFNFERGIYRYQDLFAAGMKIGLIGKNGVWYSLDGKQFHRKEWLDIVKTQYGSWGAAYDALTEEAIKRGKLVPYGTSSVSASGGEWEIELPDQSVGDELSSTEE